MEHKAQSSQEQLGAHANPFDSLLEKRGEGKALPSSHPDGARFDGIVVGTLVGLTDDGGLLVEFPGNPLEAPVRAVSTSQIPARQVGMPVAIAFVQGNVRQPLILGIIHESVNKQEDRDERLLEITRDGQRVVISAEQELVLKCGESTMTLTKDGKITIRGKHLLSRAEAVNRIKGGAVQIN